MIGGMLRKLQTKLKDNKTVAGNVMQAQEQQQPLTKEQILKNTSMAPKPPNAPVNTSGRPPVAPQGPEPVQASSLADQGQALNATMMPGTKDPWAKPKSVGVTRGLAPDFDKRFKEASGLFARFSSADPYADKYKLFPKEEEELNRYITLSRRDFGNALEGRLQRKEIDQRQAARYRREYDRRRR